MATMATDPKVLTSNLILNRLQQRVSITNAKLLLDQAKVSTGLSIENETQLSTEQAKALCLKLINLGGPSFQVGQAIYKEYLM